MLNVQKLFLSIHNIITKQNSIFCKVFRKKTAYSHAKLFRLLLKPKERKAITKRCFQNTFPQKIKTKQTNKKTKNQAMSETASSPTTEYIS